MNDAVKEKINKSTFLVMADVNGLDGASGTAFFIDQQGHFLTTSHGMADIINNGYVPYYAGIAPDQIIKRHEIAEVFNDRVRDVFLGRVLELEVTDFLTLNSDNPASQIDVVFVGYPLPKNPPDPRSPNISGSPKTFVKTWVNSRLTDHLHNTLNGNNSHGFIMSHDTIHGMSGGPVCRMDGTVQGMVLATFSNPSQNIINRGFCLNITTIQDVTGLI